MGIEARFPVNFNICGNKISQTVHLGRYKYFIIEKLFWKLMKKVLISFWQFTFNLMSTFTFSVIKMQRGRIQFWKFIIIFQERLLAVEIDLIILYKIEWWRTTLNKKFINN